jgi:hypothetical protein
LYQLLPSPIPRPANSRNRFCFVQPAGFPASWICVLELEANLSSESSAAGLVIYFSEGSGIDVQVGIDRGWMIEYVAHIQTKGDTLGFINPDGLLKVGTKIPSSRAINRA